MRNKTPRIHASRRYALTLAELVLSMAVMTILVGGIGSALLLASHALPTGSEPATNRITVCQTLDQITAELYCAQSFAARSSTTVEFTVADRNEDKNPETIRYAWSGTPGDPLTRQYNGAAAVTICDDVQDFSLAYIVQRAQQQGALAVLLIVDNAEDKDSGDKQREEAMKSWGYSVTMMSASESQDTLQAAAAASNAVYISETVVSSTLGTKLRDNANRRRQRRGNALRRVRDLVQRLLHHRQ